MTTARARARKSRQMREAAGQPWWKPTPKWWTQLVSLSGVVVAELLRSGGWDEVENGMSAAAILSLIATWAKSNEGKGG